MTVESAAIVLTANGMDRTEIAIRAIAGSDSTPEAKSQAIAAAIRRAGDFRWVGLYAVSEEEIWVIGWDGPGPPTHPRFPSDRGLCGAAASSKQAIVVDDVAADSRYLTTFGTTRSEMVVPIEESRRVVGLIDVESERLARFDGEDRAIVERWAAAAASLWREPLSGSPSPKAPRIPTTSAPVTTTDATGSPDPVAEPKQYQEHLLALVGSDDPAEVQAATPDLIRALLADGGGDVGVRPDATEWSALECIAHIVDAEIVYSARYRWIVAHDEPELIGYDQDRWVDRLHRPIESPDELLAVFEPLRRANLALWARTPAAARDRVGLHRERGRESYGLSFALIAGHDRFHVAQAERALARVRTSA